MRRLFHFLRNIFRQCAPLTNIKRHLPRKWRCALQLEALESRALLSGNPSGTVSGIAFIDLDHNGVHTANEATLAGITMTLTGTTTQNVAVKVTAVTDSSGGFNFLNVLPGTYQLQP